MAIAHNLPHLIENHQLRSYVEKVLGCIVYKFEELEEFFGVTMDVIRNMELRVSPSAMG